MKTAYDLKVTGQKFRFIGGTEIMTMLSIDIDCMRYKNSRNYLGILSSEHYGTFIEFIG